MTPCLSTRPLQSTWLSRPQGPPNHMAPLNTGPSSPHSPTAYMAPDHMTPQDTWLSDYMASHHMVLQATWALEHTGLQSQTPTTLSPVTLLLPSHTTVLLTIYHTCLPNFVIPHGSSCLQTLRSIYSWRLPKGIQCGDWQGWWLEVSQEWVGVWPLLPHDLAMLRGSLRAHSFLSPTSPV